LKKIESEKLRELDHLKSEFFANISHEFRTPLTLILGPLEGIIHGTFKGNFKEEVVIMKRNARRLLRLINQILDLAKIDAGKLKLIAAEQDLAVFIRDIVSNFESAARNKKIELISQIPKKPVMVYFDGEKMEDIL
jgi:signal transduction histidine kinase